MRVCEETKPQGALHGAQMEEESCAGTVHGEGAASPGGGLLEKVSNALVGTLLCLVDVRGEACICRRRFGACAEHGGGKRA